MAPGNNLELAVRFACEFEEAEIIRGRGPARDSGTREVLGGKATAAQQRQGHQDRW